MLTKLMKYDFIISYKKYIIMTLVLLASLATAIFAEIIDVNWLKQFSFFISILVIIVYLTLYIIVSIINGYSQMSGKESYLTYMFPVSPQKLVFSKILMALLWGFYILITCIIFWFIYGKINADIAKLFSNIKDIITNELGTSVYLLSFYLISFFILQIFIICFWICITSLPTLRNKNLGLPVAIIGGYVGNQLIGLLLFGLWIVYCLIFKNIFIFNLESNSEQFLELFKSFQIIGSILSILLCIVFYYFSVKIVEKNHTI